MSEIRDEAVSELEAQILKLRKDVAALSKEASKRGARRYNEASDSAADAWGAFVSALSKSGSNVYEGGRDQAADAYKAFVKAISKHGSRVYDATKDNAADIYDEMLERGSEAGRQLAKQARVAGRRASDTARENPVAATLVAAGVVGLLVTMLFRRSGD